MTGPGEQGNEPACCIKGRYQRVGRDIALLFHDCGTRRG